MMKNTVLYFDGCNTLELAKKYGTPLYLISETKIRERCQIIQKDFLKKYPNTKAVYASKAFLPLAMCKIIGSEGIGLDIVSGGELYTAIQADFPLEMIEFNGNNKSRDELELAVENKIGRIIVDNLHELLMLEEICKSKNHKMDILFRIVPEIETDTHEYISTGHKSSKFGVSLNPEVFFNTFERAINSEHLNMKGIHFHIGSQLHDNSSHINAAFKTLNLILDIKNKYNFDIKELNIGGGFGIKYTDEDDTKSLSYFIDPTMKTINDFCKSHDLIRPQVIIEPGRWIVGEAGITLYEIGAIKENGDKKFASIDGGMADNIRPSLYQAKYHAVVANNVSSTDKETVTISGKFCESSDILIKDINLPILSSGDILAVFSTGAYNYSMANNYNKVVIPPVVLLHKGSDNIIVKKQDYTDLIRNELIPTHLEA